jgi:hypothetical protein
MATTLGSLDPMSELQHARRRAITTGVAILAVLAVGLLLVVKLWPDSSSPSKDEVKGPDLTWERLADGSQIPVSRAGGPRRFGEATASGFAQSELGAAMAAMHISIRAAGGLGPKVFEPTIREQVIGENASAMLARVAQEYESERSKQGIPAGAALPAGSAQLVAYKVDAYGSDHATVTVISAYASDATKYFGYRVDLRWANGDWRVIAPPQGSFATMLTQFSSLPDGAVQLEKKD